jgi:hypothetical protein
MSLYRPEKPNTFDTILRPCCRKITPMKHTIAQFIKRLAASIGFEIERTSNRICPWKDDAEFVSLFKRSTNILYWTFGDVIFFTS